MPAYSWSCPRCTEKMYSAYKGKETVKCIRCGYEFQNPHREEEHMGPKIVMAYSGKVSGMPQFLQGMFPRNVILISAYKQRKTASAKAVRAKDKRNLSLFILPDNLA